MIYISHRGNTSEINRELENSPDYINEALEKNFYVEIDLWVIEDKLYLGHDGPEYLIDQSYLNNKYFYVHCKNKEALVYMNFSKLDCEYFWHQEDYYTLTSKNKIWVHGMHEEIPDSICVVLDKNTNKNLSICYGICSDYVEFYREAINI